VATVADRLGVAGRGLARRFAARVGCPPKRYARVRRFQRAARWAAESLAAQRVRPDWAGIAAHCGYVDQPHLVHDFREFAGVTPSRYRPRAAAAPGDGCPTAAGPTPPALRRTPAGTPAG